MSQKLKSDDIYLIYFDSSFKTASDWLCFQYFLSPLYMDPSNFLLNVKWDRMFGISLDVVDVTPPMWARQCKI